MRQNNTRRQEAGNAFLFILIAVILFAALAYTISRGMRSDGTSRLTGEKVELAVTEILNFSQRVERAINRLRRDGCSEGEISFQRDVNGNGSIQNIAADHYNPNAPVDKSCHVYDAAGGQVLYRDVAGMRLDGSASNSIEDIGCNGNEFCTDMTFVIHDVPDDICAAINQKLGVTGIPADLSGAGGFVPFVGVFQDLTDVADTDANLTGKSAACYSDSDDDENIYYYVLIAR